MSNDAPDDGYSPAGFEQIVLDEFRRHQTNVSHFGVRCGLSAVGHQLRSEPADVESALQLVLTNEDKQTLTSAVGLMASILFEGVPRDQLVSPIRFPVSFVIPDGLDAEDRLACWLIKVMHCSDRPTTNSTESAKQATNG